jgi:16S rRNA (guanine527-N7)-methyltransferase
MTFGELLRRDVAVSDEQIVKLEAHYELMLKWNRTINLTSVTEMASAVRKHYAESIFLAKHLPTGRYADVGSGAGFPGIPAAIVRPDLSVTLVESDQRKAVFLREAAANLANVNVLAARAEGLDSTFDGLVSRAVRPEQVATLVPKLAPQAWMLLTRGQKDWQEIAILPWDATSSVMFHVEHKLV